MTEVPQSTLWRGFSAFKSFSKASTVQASAPQNVGPRQLEWVFCRIRVRYHLHSPIFQKMVPNFQVSIASKKSIARKKCTHGCHITRHSILNSNPCIFIEGKSQRPLSDLSAEHIPKNMLVMKKKKINNQIMIWIWNDLQYCTVLIKDGKYKWMKCTVLQN